MQLSLHKAVQFLLCRESALTPSIINVDIFDHKFPMDKLT
jgi:hypothetical protein